MKNKSRILIVRQTNFDYDEIKRYKNLHIK